MNKRVKETHNHSGAWKQHPNPHESNTKAPTLGPVVLDDFDDGWPGHKEHFIIYP